MTSPIATHDMAAAVRNSSRRATAARPRVSLVLVSRGSRSELRRSLSLIAGAAHRLTDLVIVRAEAMAPELRTLLARTGATYLEAPATASIAELRSLGMMSVAGDIVRIVEDVHLKDLAWLERRRMVTPAAERSVALPTTIEPDLSPRALPHPATNRQPAMAPQSAVR